MVSFILLLNTWTCELTELILLPHGVDEVTWAHTLVVGLGELLSSAVKSTTESGADCKETRHKSRDQVLSSTGGDDGVHSTRHGGTVIGSKHEHHFQELAGVVGQPAAEPQERHDTTDTDLLFEHIRDVKSGVTSFLSSASAVNQQRWVS